MISIYIGGIMTNAWDNRNMICYTTSTMSSTWTPRSTLFSCPKLTSIPGQQGKDNPKHACLTRTFNTSPMFITMQTIVTVCTGHVHTTGIVLGSGDSALSSTRATLSSSPRFMWILLALTRHTSWQLQPIVEHSYILLHSHVQKNVHNVPCSWPSIHTHYSYVSVPRIWTALPGNWRKHPYHIWHYVTHVIGRYI